MRIEASTLEEAYKIASEKLDVSINDLEIEVIQYPSSLFGLFKKNAIIEVSIKELTIERVIEIIKPQIENLLSKICFNVYLKNIYKFDEDTIFIHIEGDDSGLLIGKEGYRYDAFYKLLFSWINQKYGFNIRLEVGEFLENQEKLLRGFLEPIIKKVENQGFAKTKPLKTDTLTFLSLKILREVFPDKYVAVKERDKEKFIVIGEKWKQ